MPYSVGGRRIAHRVVLSSVGKSTFVKVVTDTHLSIAARTWHPLASASVSVLFQLSVLSSITSQ
jgi:hypothetical protein